MKPGISEKIAFDILCNPSVFSLSNRLLCRDIQEKYGVHERTARDALFRARYGCVYRERVSVPVTPEALLRLHTNPACLPLSEIVGVFGISNGTASRLRQRATRLPHVLRRFAPGAQRHD